MTGIVKVSAWKTSDGNLWEKRNTAVEHQRLLNLKALGLFDAGQVDVVAQRSAEILSALRIEDEMESAHVDAKA